MTRIDETSEPRRRCGNRRDPEAHRAILDAAAALLVEAGLAGVSIEAVARRAGCGKPTIYRWWPDRTALLLELFERDIAEIAPAPGQGDLEADLIALKLSVWRAWRETSAGEMSRAAIIELQGSPEKVAFLRERIVPLRFAYLDAMLAAAQARGELAAETDLGLLRDMIFGHSWYRLLTGQLDDDGAVIASTRLIIAGLRAQGLLRAPGCPAAAGSD